MEPLSLVVTVQCLSCGSTYSKPDSDTARTNPGCPTCGYLGWSRENGVTNEPEPPRFDAHLLQDRLGQPH